MTWNKHKSSLLTIAFLVITGGSIAQVTDKDGNNYKTVKIGKQEWTAENLDVSHFRNGDTIPEAEDPAEWQQAGNAHQPAWCYYNSDSAAGPKYHKLYNWYAVMDPRGLAPGGWHIPTTVEWSNLTAYLGSENIAGTKMKTTNGWDGTNESGFAALPGGYRNNSGAFSHLGSIGSWWSASAADPANAWSRSLGNGSVVSRSYDGKRVGLAVRCLRD
jgi:uncharacterized protein (TIGR02145 family)